MSKRNVDEAKAETMDYTGISLHWNNRKARVTLHCSSCQVVAGKSLGCHESAVHEHVKSHVLDALGCGHKVTICKCVEV